MSCAQFTDLLLTLEEMRNLYPAQVDEEFYHYYDLAQSSEDLSGLIDKLCLILQLFRREGISTRTNYNKLRTYYLPKVGGLVQELYFTTALGQRNCSKVGVELYGELRPEHPINVVLRPFFTSFVKGDSSELYGRLIQVLSLLPHK